MLQNRGRDTNPAGRLRRRDSRSAYRWHSGRRLRLVSGQSRIINDRTATGCVAGEDQVSVALSRRGFLSPHLMAQHEKL